MMISNRHIKLFQSLFKGREDIYTRRWENEDRDDYMPAYNVDWDKYDKHKALGGTFQNLKHKKPAPAYSSGYPKAPVGKGNNRHLLLTEKQ